MTATITPEVRGKRRAGKEDKRQPEPLEMWHVVLIDDDVHTYPYVVNMLGRLFGHPTECGFRLALEVDTAGRCVVATTHKELAELKRDQIHAFGDAGLPGCRGSMRATIVRAD